jgi:hypothetical protein
MRAGSSLRDAFGGRRRTAYGPPGTAWDRLGPDIFFSPRKNGEENLFVGLWFWFTKAQPVGVEKKSDYVG